MTAVQSLGILGGGQLARLMCEAARDLKLHTLVLSPDAEAVARNYCDQFLHADYQDAGALEQLAGESDVITLDNEHVPLPALEVLQPRTVLHPGLGVMRRISDRLAQRGLLTSLNLPQARFWSIDKPVAVRAAQRSAVFPAVLKTRHGGYDGLGQKRVSNAQELPAAWEALQRRPCVLEAWLTDVEEFSLVGARDAGGDIRLYPPILNLHSEGQLQRSELPLALPDGIREQAENAWRKIANGLTLRGVMAVEFFISQQGELWINEIAPRVHNSGHVTQMAFDCSQFELHVRAVTGMPLPELGSCRAAVMLNLYPEHGLNDGQDAAKVQAQVGGQLIWYDKTPRPRRKMGHWLLPPDKGDAAARLLAGAA